MATKPKVVVTGAVHLFVNVVLPTSSRFGHYIYGRRPVACGNKGYRIDASGIAAKTTCKDCRATDQWTELYRKQSPPVHDNTIDERLPSGHDLPRDWMKRTDHGR